MLDKNWPQLGYRTDIQGLRALAVLLVIIFHADFHFLKGGYLGVDVFFVISGYLISGLLFKELNSADRIDFKRFYARRIRRILPLSVFVTLATLVFFAFNFSPVELLELSKTTLFTSLFSSNIWFVIQATDYFGTNTETNPLLHTWSLGVEEQFYFLWPALLALLPIFSASRKYWQWQVFFVSLLSLVAFLYLFYENQPLAFFGMPTRAWQFGFGALIHFIPAYKLVNRFALNCTAIIGLVFILFTSMHVTSGFSGNPLWAILPTIGACAIIWAGQTVKDHLVYRLLSIPPVVFVGTLSYSLYLWHWPVFMYLKLDSGHLNSLNVFFGLLAIFCLSFLSYKYIEAALRSHKKLNSNSRTFLLGGSLVVVGVGISFLFYSYAKLALDSKGQQKISAVQFATEETRDCITKIKEIKLADCVLGDISSDTSIVLIGDSKAQQWMPVVSEIGRKQGWKVIPIIKAGCPSVYVDIYSGYLGREYRECNQWRDLAIKAVIKQKPDLILLSHYGGYGFIKNGNKSSATLKGWGEGYRKFGEKLATVDLKILYLRDNPQFPMDVPNCLSRKVGGGDIYESMCESSASEVNVRKPIFDVAVMELQKFNGAHFLDLISEYCSDDVCPTYRNNVVRYVDKHHLSYEFTKELSPIIEDKLLKILDKNVPQK
jgi:peptidoglycan/LPS O-acetylase OafA/YrhL